ncbi:hypothetical protein AMATHDRAFT_5003 [Amanita thiersii Skay4041]|uniref:Retrotransposon gag domain-containing protein n=1 Tax=Amanita thiersii Skay4041 TaxID=703135 RepID=A0A2A9NGU9_9AGAR|nr:hypothetical protein AMATHDRAFT_5003 [Amanita thiersii Skay4041]
MMVGGAGGGTEEPDWSLDQALAQIQQLLGAVNNLQHTIAQQGQMIAQLQAQAPGQTATPRGPKMAMPQIYDEVDPIELLYSDIYKVFGDPNKQATTIQEIMTIRQGSKTGEEHVQLFKQCYMRSNYGEMAGIHEFKRSLNTPLLDKCMAIPNLPDTLEKWYNLVIRLDWQWRQMVAKWKIFAA